MQFVQAFFREAPNRTTLYDYEARTDGQPVYIGHAPNRIVNEAMVQPNENAGGWTIYKYTYDVSTGYITKTVSTGDEAIWALRADYFS